MQSNFVEIKFLSIYLSEEERNKNNKMVARDKKISQKTKNKWWLGMDKFIICGK